MDALSWGKLNIFLLRTKIWSSLYTKYFTDTSGSAKYRRKRLRKVHSVSAVSCQECSVPREVLEGRAPFQLSLRPIGQAQSLQLGVLNKFYDEELGTESLASATML